MKLKQDAMPLSYTPRKLISHPSHQLFYTIESDHRSYGEDVATKKLEELVRPNFVCTRRLTNLEWELQASRGQTIDREMVDLPPATFGRVKAPAGTWGSCIRIIDPVQVCFLSLTLMGTCL